MRNQIACCLLLTLVACTNLGSENPIAEAQALRTGAEKCLIDVRDNELKYDAAESCKTLGKLSRSYIEAGGQLPNEPIKTKLIAEQAVKMAWNAQAVSATNNPSISLW